VRTLDSLAWTLQRYLVEEDLLTGSYSDNIERMIGLLREPPQELRDYLDGIRVVVIDEAQDLVGRRSDLSVGLIRSLPAGAGVTVFADPAQAIYGDWSLDEGELAAKAAPLHERILAGEVGEFEELWLERNYRTSDPQLLQIATELRVLALVRDQTDEEAHRKMRDALAEHGDQGRVRVSDLPALVQPGSSQFFLFRTHGEVVELSSHLSQGGMRHRLRFPGLPRPVYPWIGRLLYRGASRRFKRQEFERLWAERVEGTYFGNGDPDAAWRTLLEVAGDDDLHHVDLLHLREILSRRNPPDDVIAPALGTEGPILSTIHGSKGREADEVVLGLTKLSGDADHGEEARVLYVGATRAREELTTVEMSGRHAYLPSRRAWRFVRGSRVQLEFGVAGDVDGISPVSHILGGDALALDRQEQFAAMGDGLVKATWSSRRFGAAGSGTWRRVLTSDEGGAELATCGSSLENDLWEISRRSRGEGTRPPDSQRHLYVVDFTTVAVDNDSPDLNTVTRTFAKSGFWVAPLLKGYSLVFPRGGQRR
jgi:hypothetical protein